MLDTTSSGKFQSLIHWGRGFFRSPNRAAFLVCFLFLVAGAWAGQWKVVGDRGVESDYFIGTLCPEAEGLLSGQGYHNPYRGPGFIGLIAAGRLLFPQVSSYAIGRTISLLAGCGFLLSWFGIASYLAGSSLASLMMVFLAAHPLVWRYSLTASTDLLYHALVSAALYFACRKRGVGNWMACGAFLGYAYMTRYPAGMIILACAVGLALFPREESRKKRVRAWFPLGCASAVVVMPWLIANFLWNGSPFFQKNYANLAMAFYSEGRGDGKVLQEFSKHFSSLGDVLQYDPWMAAHSVGGTIMAFLVRMPQQMAPFPLFYVALAGLFFTLPWRGHAAQMILLFLGGHSVFHFLGWYHERFFLVWAPFLTLTALMFLRSVLWPEGQSPAWRRQMAILAIGLAVWGYWASLSRGEVLHRYALQPPEYLRVL